MGKDKHPTNTKFKNAARKVIKAVRKVNDDCFYWKLCKTNRLARAGLGAQHDVGTSANEWNCLALTHRWTHVLRLPDILQ